jgi:hypothetical protein
MSVVTSKIYNRIKGKGRGWVFGPADFLDIGSRDAVDQVLSRLVKQDKIRRLGRGVYDFPKTSQMFGVVSPDSADIARVLAAGDSITPSGAMAANMLHLSTQVPSKPVFLSNRTARVFSYGKRIITIKKTGVTISSKLSYKMNLLIQALNYLGKGGVDKTTILRCSDIISDDDFKSLKKNMNSLPSWLCDVIHKIDDVKYGRVRKIAQ